MRNNLKMIVAALAVFMMISTLFAAVVPVLFESTDAESTTSLRYYWDFTDDDAYSNDGKTISTKTGAGYNSNTATYVSTSGTFTDTHNSTDGLIRSNTHTYYSLGTDIVLDHSKNWSVTFKVIETYLIDGYYNGYLIGNSTNNTTTGIWNNASATSNAYAIYNPQNTGNNSVAYSYKLSSLPNGTLLPTTERTVKIYNSGNGYAKCDITFGGNTYSEQTGTGTGVPASANTLNTLFGYYLDSDKNAFCFNGKIAYIDIQIGDVEPTTNYVVSFVSNNSEYGTVSPASVTVPSGTEITADSNKLTVGTNIVTATPTAPSADYNYYFNNWSGVTSTVTSDMTIMANFVRAEPGDTVRYYWDFTDDDSYSADGKTINAKNEAGFNLNSATLVGSTVDTHNSTDGLIRNNNTQTYYSLENDIILEKNKPWSVTMVIKDQYSSDTYYDGYILGNTINMTGEGTAQGIWACSSTGTSGQNVGGFSYGPGGKGSNEMFKMPSGVTYNINDIRTIKVYNSGNGIPKVDITVNGNTYSGLTYSSTYSPADLTLDALFGYFDCGDFKHYSFNGKILSLDVVLPDYTPAKNYTVTIESNNPSYGTVSPVSVTVPGMTAITVNENTLTIGSNTVTATPAAATQEYIYEFENWSGVTSTVTSDMTITANFTRSEVGTAVHYYWDFTDDASYTNDGRTISTKSGSGMSSNSATLVGSTVDTHNSTDGLIRSNTQTYYTLSNDIVLSKSEYWSITVVIVDQYKSNNYYDGYVLGTTTAASAQGFWVCSGESAAIGVCEFSYGTSTKTSAETFRLTSPASYDHDDLRTITIYNSGNGVPKVNITVNGTTYSGLTYSSTFTPTDLTLNVLFGYFGAGSEHYSFNGKIRSMDVQIGGAPPATNYTVSFVSNDSGYGTVSPSSITVPGGTAIVVNGNILTIGSNTVTATPATATAQYEYSFSNWSGVTSTVTSNMTITANFVRNEVGKHTVSFDSNGGSPTYDPQTVDDGGYATRPATDPTKTDYSFAGWYNGDDLFDFQNTPITSDVTLKAHWIYAGGPINMAYDDRYDVSDLGQPSSITGTPTSKQVGSDTPDAAVVVYSNGKLIATGVGTATVEWASGDTRTVIVSPSHISMIYIIGHSFGYGQEGTAAGSIKCADGTAYYSGQMSGSPTGKGIGYGSSSRLSVDDLTSGSGHQGEASGVAYQWYNSTDTKAWVICTAVSGTALNTWVPGGTQYNNAKTTYIYAQSVMDAEVDAGHYILDHIVMIQHTNANGDATYAISDYLSKWNSMWSGFKTDLSMQIGSETRTVEAIGLCPMISMIGYSSTKNYLELSNGEVCNYYIGTSNDYPDAFLLSDLENI